jgi:putative membrane protein
MKGKIWVNRYHLVKITLLLGFSLFFLIILLTGAVSFYVHPRIQPYLIFAAAVMTLIALMMLPRLKAQPDEKRSLWPIALFALPLLMTLIFPPQSMGSAGVSTSDLMAAGQSASTGVSAQPASNADAQAPEDADAQRLLPKSRRSPSPSPARRPARRTSPARMRRRRSL